MQAGTNRNTSAGVQPYAPTGAMMAKVLGFLHRLEWHSPYTNPPNGKRVLAEVFLPAKNEGCRQCPREIEDLWITNPGYSHSIRAITEFPKELGRETLKAVRQKRLKRRMEEKYPLFAEVFIQEELTMKKDYYDGITDPSIEEKRNEIKKLHNEEKIRLGIV